MIGRYNEVDLTLPASDKDAASASNRLEEGSGFIMNLIRKNNGSKKQSWESLTCGRHDKIPSSQTRHVSNSVLDSDETKTSKTALEIRRDAGSAQLNGASIRKIGLLVLPIMFIIAFLVTRSSTDGTASKAQVSSAPSSRELWDALDSARSIWIEQSITDYTYSFQRECFCPKEFTRRMTITVKDSKFDWAVYADDGSPVPEEITDSPLGTPTIDDMFEAIQSAIDADARQVFVAYDPILGYPLSIYVDYINQISQEELKITTQGLVQITNKADPIPDPTPSITLPVPVDCPNMVKLLASDGSRDDKFGGAVAIRGSVAVVGAPFDGDRAYRAGSVYIFEKNNNGEWTETAKLLPEETQTKFMVENEFGRTISISEDGKTIFVGSVSGDHMRSGKVYIYSYDEGKVKLQSKLTAGERQYRFGYSLAYDDNTLAVLESNESFVYVRDGSKWVREAKLSHYDNGFGYQIALSGDYAIVGHTCRDRGFGSGAASVFRRKRRWVDKDGERVREIYWVRDDELIADDGEGRDNCGAAVAISGTFAFVGCPGDNDRGSNSGSIYIYVREENGKWVPTSKLLAADGIQGDQFGSSISVDKNVLVTGSPWRSWAKTQSDGEEGGMVYTFSTSNGSTWKQDAKYFYPLGDSGDLFGNSVSFDGLNIISGGEQSWGKRDDDESNGYAFIITACGM